jgi:hypothetical protein
MNKSKESKKEMKQLLLKPEWAWTTNGNGMPNATQFLGIIPIHNYFWSSKT